MTGRRWLTPPDYTAEWAEVSLPLPNNPWLLAVLRGVLLTLSDPSQWEQIPEFGIEPESAAGGFLPVLLAFEAWVDGSG